MNRTSRSFSTSAGVPRASLKVPMLLLALAAPMAMPQELTLKDVTTYRPSFEYEQCANACQIEVDKMLSSCMNEALEAKADVSEPCTTGALARHEACLKSCPVDTGDKRLFDDVQ